MIDEDGRQLLHRLQDEDSWLGAKGIQRREALASRIEEKQTAADIAARKAEEERLRIEAENTDRSRIGIFDPDAAIVERNRKRKEEMEQIEDGTKLDLTVSVFHRTEKKDSGSSPHGVGWAGGRETRKDKLRWNKQRQGRNRNSNLS